MDDLPPAKSRAQENPLLSLSAILLTIIVAMLLLCLLCGGVMILVAATNSYCFLPGAYQFIGSKARKPLPLVVEERLSSFLNPC